MGSIGIGAHTSSEIPLLDMSWYTSGSELERRQFCASLLQSFSHQGMVKLINHSIREDDIKSAFHWNKELFNLPEETKSQIKRPAQANPNRGWCPKGHEKSYAITDFEKGQKKDKPEILDVKESFDMGALDDPLYDNKWLAEEKFPGFRPFMEKFYGECHNLHTTLLEAVEEGFRAEGHNVDLQTLCKENVSEMRLNYYPPIHVRELRSERVNRISEHTDFGTFTLLLQDSVGGLEVENQSDLGTYFPVEASSMNEILVNVGDSLQRITNDFFTSVSHRVVVPSSFANKDTGIIAGRYSIAYFAKVARAQSLKPLPMFVDPNETPKYEDMTAFEWNQIKLKKIYG
ncbi:hypothetical protein PVAG01_07461 [Phlyctema vagabunda]|uniref:Fe2OG dioxygenase domain-containing protein n=1 Tax=Phlyctema vagabunda TaxID=108571 RepID=A0ABR4PCH6_9HELO